MKTPKEWDRAALEYHGPNWQARWIEAIQSEAWIAGMTDAKSICAIVDSDLVSGMDTARECEMRIESTIYAHHQRHATTPPCPS